MTVAYLINQYPQPSQAFIRREIRALEGLGLDVRRYTLRRSPGPLVDEGDEAERRGTRAVLDGGAIGLLGALLRTMVGRPRAFLRALGLAVRVGRASERGVAVHLVYLAEACVLLRWMTGEGVRHVHAHFGTNSTTVAMLCRVLGGPPYSFTAHGPEEFDMPRALSLGEKIRRAKFVVAISEFGRSQLLRWAPHEDWAKVHVVRCGVDEDYLVGPPEPVPQAPRLVCVGRLVEQKGQLILVEAVARLRRRGIRPQVTLVGDGPMRADVEGLIDRLGLGDDVRVAGWMSNAEVRREIQAARAMVLPSFAEGLPVVIMEALALGRPAISTAIAGIPELLRPGECGWVVAPGSVEALEGAMYEALTMPAEELARMGRAGSDRVADRHDARKEAAKLIGLFEGTPAPSPDLPQG